MRIVIYVKNHNLDSGNISLKKSHIQAYWNGLIESIDVYSEDKQFLEAYYGKGLQDLIMSARDYDKYFLATRWFAKQEEV